MDEAVDIIADVLNNLPEDDESLMRMLEEKNE
jgi:hypothetical protein